MIALNSNPNVDNSDLANYPDGRIKDNDGTGNGTGVNRSVYGDLHSNISKIMRLYAIAPTGLPDNEANGYQIIDALRGLASKNDFIYPLSTNGTILNVDIKFSQMLDNEFIVCMAAFNKSTETQIKGIGAGSFNITYSGDFKANEYVRVIKTGAGVSIIRLADALSLDAMVAELNFLKKASQAQENAGALNTVATTPLTNLTAFIKRVIGTDSPAYLATSSNNGLYPSTHYDIVAGLAASSTRNIGWLSGVEIGGGSVGANYAVSGDIVSAVIQSTSGNRNIIRITIANTMTNNDYFVEPFIESQGSLGDDSQNYGVVFKPITATTFDIVCREPGGVSQSLKIHLKVVKI